MPLEHIVTSGSCRTGRWGITSKIDQFLERKPLASNWVQRRCHCKELGTLWLAYEETQRGRDIQREKTNLVNALESHWYSDMLKTVVQNKIKEHPPESHKTGNSACKEIVKRGWRGRILSATKLHNDGMERTYWVMQVLNDKGRRRVADGGDG